MTVLPRKPSKLLRIALADLVKVERSKKYVIDMGTYHTPISEWDMEIGRHCAVCLAGSIMARTLGSDPKDRIIPSDFGETTARKLYAVSDLQFGNIHGGLIHLNYATSTINRIIDQVGEERNMPGYLADPVAYKNAVRNLANDFEAAGF